MRRALRPLALFCVYLVVGSGAGVLLAAGAPMVLGMRSFTVLSGSMEPTIHTGDITVDEQISPLDARPGDVVTFRDPRGQSRLITHRLRSIHVEGGTARMVSKGDANDTTENWTVPTGGKIGRVAYRLPKLGYALALTREPGAKFLLIVVPALLFGLLELRRIWRPRREAEADGSPA
ncbi:MAG: signal peptidase [Thermoleophilaceae bacterium]|nr:signal peptidase [Thermoleophilaceae bacterium]